MPRHTLTCAHVRVHTHELLRNIARYPSSARFSLPPASCLTLSRLLCTLHLPLPPVLLRKNCRAFATMKPPLKTLANMLQVTHMQIATHNLAICPTRHTLCPACLAQSSSACNKSLRKRARRGACDKCLYICESPCVYFLRTCC